MQFEWDERKRARNWDVHGVDFVDAASIFEGPVLEAEDRRRDYGERRFVAIGLSDGACFVVVWTPRGANRRPISAWKGGRDERQRYEDRLAGGDPPDAGAGRGEA